jgi:hypothetical protein
MKRPRRFGVGLMLLAAVGLVASPGTGVAETKSFVLSYFYPANYFGEDTCPGGLNPLPDVFFKRDLKILGVPQAEVDAAFNKDYPNQNAPPTTRWVMLAATRGNGKDNVYVHPTSVPDAHLKPAVGRFGYGFNLDGLGAASPGGYEDPETHERGVNNHLFRATGCVQAYKGYPPPQPPLEPEYRWDYSRGTMGAWLISIAGADLSRDGDVTVTLQTSIDPVTTQDANAHLQSDMTYRVAEHPASLNVLRGHLRDGVVTTVPAEIAMQCAPYLQPLYEFRRARLRLKIKTDGTLEGVLGGYQPWYPFYWSHAKVGYIDERGFGVDSPALYYALRREADGHPDPRTGENTTISAAYMIEAVPAFVHRMPAATDDAGGGHRTLSALRLSSRLSAAFKGLGLGSDPPAVARPAIVRRLRPNQYRQIIADVFGPSIRVEGRFEPDVRDDGLFAVGAGHVGITATGMEQFDGMARGIAAQVVSRRNRATLIPCVPQSATSADAACAAKFFALAGPLLIRRPVSPTELELQVKLAGAAADALGDFYRGIELGLTGMLESPQFLFRQERIKPDASRPGEYRLDAFGTASQLSFLLWNAGPDRRLLAAAAAGELDTERGLAREVDRMLASPRLETGIRAFFTDMLQFDLFDALAKDAKIFPKWTVRAGPDAQEQTLRTIVELLLTEHGDYRDLFVTRKTFLTPLLGSLYRVPVAQNSVAWQPYQFPAGDAHAGIQSQASFVALHSHEGMSSPTLRGKALREVLLCAPVPVPPANVNFSVAQDTHNANLRTMRERLTAHRNDPTCAGCHKLMDPAGLALENFDSDGGFRTTENGRPLDTSGELDGVEFRDAAGLGHALHDNPATPACLVRRLHAYATGHAAGRGDMPWIRALERGFADDGYRVPELLRRMATSDNLYKAAAPAALVAVADAKR